MSTPITTEADPLAVNYDFPPLPSQGFGLYAAATLIDGQVPRELLAGINGYPYNCDTGFGTYSTELCDDSPATKSAGARGDVAHFAPIVVYGTSECAPDQSEDEVFGRARQNRTLHEPLLVESAFATRLLTDAGAPATAASFAEAVGKLEEWLGERGYAGVIHASRRFAVQAADISDATGSAVLRTNIGNTWSFGGGYASALGNTLVVTGPVTIWRSTPFEQVVTTGSSRVAPLNNTVYALSERVVTVGYECAAHAVTITP